MKLRTESSVCELVMGCKRKEKKYSILSLIHHIDAAIIPVVQALNVCFQLSIHFTVLYELQSFYFKNNVSGPHTYNPDPDPGFYAEPNLISRN
jgi:hypothetical protein